MKQKEIDKIFPELFDYWAKRFNIKYISCKRDNRIYCNARVKHKVKNKKYQYKCLYSTKSMKRYKRWSIIHIVLHELGHLKRHAFYENMGRVKAEFEAESQALKWLKRYYPRYYKWHINWMKRTLKDKTSWNTSPYYRKAFSKIKEYQI